MKKIFSAILALMMIVGCASFVSAKEPVIESGNLVAVAIDDVTVTDATGEIIVPINIKFADGFDGIIGSTLKLTFDTTKLAFDKKASSIEYPDASMANVNINSKNVITLQYIGADLETGVAEDGVFANLVFTAIEGATGDAVVEFDSVKFSQVGNTAVAGNFTNGKVSLGGAAETPKYEVTFDGEDAQEYEEGTEITLPTPADKEGYSFLGWSDGTEVYTGKYTVTGAVDFVSEWEINKYTVTVEDEKNDTTEESVEYNSQFTLPTPAAVDGFTFAGWECNGETYEAGAKVTVKDHMTFTAVWEEIGKFTVTYIDDKNGTTTETVYDGAVITLPTPAAVEGFTFKTWDANGATYDAGVNVKVVTNVTLTAVWEAVKYTVKIGDDDAEEIAYGTVITLPTLTDDELSFKGWKVNDTDEIVAGGATYTVTAAVTFTAVWGGGKKVYLDTTGDDSNDGFTKETPVKTLKKAMQIIIDDAKADNTLDTIVIVNLYEKKNESGAALQYFGKGAGKKVYITGLTADSVFDMRWYDGTTLKDSHIRFNTDVEFNNIKIYGASKDGGLLAMGSELTFGENVVLAGGSQNVGVAHYDNIYSDNSVINVNSGTWSAVHYAGISGANVVGTTTLNFNGGKAAGIFNGHGWRNNNVAYGVNYININGGEVGKINLNPIGTSSVTSYAGLRYFTINDGTIGDVTTTGVGTNSYKDGETDKYVNATIRDGVTVFEVNGGTIGKFATCGVDDDATRVIINNTENALTVEDTGAIVLNVKNGKLHAEATGLDEAYTWGTSADQIKAILEWAKGIELAGFTYEVDGDYNAVQVGDERYMLADLDGDLIPAPEAGAYDVEFINVYKVTVHGVDYYRAEGEVLSLKKLNFNNGYKHIGWTTVEGSMIPEYAPDANITVTSDMVLYSIWATSVYFTISFVSEHGEQIDPISLIDDDEDGKADEATRLPGYDTAVKYDDHFTFLGWSEDEVATEVTIAAGAAIENLAENIVLYAVWAEDAKATVTYVDAQGTAPEAVTDYVGTEITVAVPATAEGLEFLGWTDGENVYQAGDKLTITEDGITLTAKWGVKVTVDVNGAKGDAPVIGGTIGEEIDLPTSVELTKINSTFVGFALSADGEVITGKYTVNPEDTLYVIWEEAVADAGLIKTKVTYYTGAGNYLVDVYFYGKDANTVAFGYAFGENLEFAGFTPAEGLSAVPADLETIAEGYYAYAVTDETDGKIEGADKTEDTAILLGTIAFTYTGTKEDYETDCADCNVAITAPAEAIENISSEEYFLYTPAVAGLEVEGKPVVFDEAIEIEIIDVVYTLTGSVKVVREDGTAPKNYATITAYNAAGIAVKTFTIEDEATETTDGVFNYSIELPEGSYTLEINKIGYMPASVDVEIVAQEGADEEGFVPEEVAVEAVELIAGDVVDARGEIDLLDFAAITSTFDVEIADEFVVALDINEDGVVSVDDLAYVKQNYGASNAQ
ncbi:MAG: InlB B-repeat-containing protein [Clostridia bacterium]|nr:InlB B-repeat-containing protein [Clostridia bacterium]